MSFKWRDSFSIGHPGIDAEHQNLFELADAFTEATTTAERTACADRLFDYTRQHFGHEEALMRELNYPDIWSHLEQHHSLIERLKEIALRVASDTLTPTDLKKFLTAWLVGHIVTFDTRLAAFVAHHANDGQGGAEKT